MIVWLLLPQRTGWHTSNHWIQMVFGNSHSPCWDILLSNVPLARRNCTKTSSSPEHWTENFPVWFLHLQSMEAKFPKPNEFQSLVLWFLCHLPHWEWPFGLIFFGQPFWAFLRYVGSKPVRCISLSHKCTWIHVLRERSATIHAMAKREAGSWDTMRFSNMFRLLFSLLRWTSKELGFAEDLVGSTWIPSERNCAGQVMLQKPPNRMVNLSHKNSSNHIGLSSRNSWLESLKTQTIHDSNMGSYQIGSNMHFMWILIYLDPH